MILALTRIPFTSPLVGYLRLEIRRQLRNRRYLLFAMVFPTLIYLLYTNALGGDPSASIAGISWGAYFLASMAAYGAIATAMSLATGAAVERVNGWIRQLRVMPLPGWGFVGGKVATSMLLTVPSVVLVSLAAIAINHVALPGGAFVMLAISLVLGVLPFACFGLLLGYLLDPDSAQGGMVLSLLVFAVLGGLFAPVTSFPEPLATIAHVLPSYQLAQLARDAVSGTPPDLTAIAVLLGYAIVIGTLAAWRYRAEERRASV